MAENKEVVKISGLSIASIVLGITSIALWCAWFVSIPCAIIALIFGIVGLKKPGKGLAITGLVTGAITLVIWILLFIGAFMYGFMEGLSEIEDNTYHHYSSSRYLY